MDPARGITSDLVSLTGREGHRLTGWLRKLRGTGQIMYLGFYSHCVSPSGKAFLKVSFPLPNGAAVVVMCPTVGEDGSLLLQSAGSGFGDAGFYLLANRGGEMASARYVRAMRESIHVCPADEGLRADHTLTLFGMAFLRLHYRLLRSSQQA